MLERKNEVLCILTQKIVTTQKCVISEHIQTEEKCGGMVGIKTKTVQVCASMAWRPGPEATAASLAPTMETLVRGLFEWCLSFVRTLSVAS